MKLNNNLFYILLITIGILGLLVGLHKKRENYNIRNSLSPIISGGKRILAKEHFESPSSRVATAVAAAAAAEKEEEEKEAAEAEKITQSKPEVILDENIEDNEQHLTDLMQHLDLMENKCSDYEKKEREKIKTETEYLKEKYKEQLEIENEKIEQLKDLVNYYRKRYYKKLKINNKCRGELQSKLDDDTEFVKDLGDLVQDNQIKLNVDGKQLLDKLKH